MLTVDQQLWWAPSEPRSPSYAVTVVALGRKWATLSNGEKIGLKSLRGRENPDYGRAGVCYLTKDAHDAVIEARGAYSDMRKAMGYGLPRAGVTAADIAAARKLLRLDEEVPDEEED